MNRIAFIHLVCLVSVSGALAQGPLSLWYEQPAASWNEALPLGNGRLGAMVFGGVGEERLQLNEESCWSGAPHDFVNPDARKALPAVRKLLFEGRYVEAKNTAQEKFMGNKGIPSAYQTLGDLFLSFDHDESKISGYLRRLDISNAVASVTYKHDGILYSREFFSNAPDNVIMIRITADKPGSVSLSGKVTRPGDKAVFRNDDDQIVMSEHVGNGTGVRMTLRLRVQASGGRSSAERNGFVVSNADEVVIQLTAATDYRKQDPEAVTAGVLENVRHKSWDKIRDEHIKDYRHYFDRLSLDLGQTDAIYFPTDQRLKAMRNGSSDPNLIALYYQFGRYLLISSSRPGSLPANLQGIWADGLNPPWDADYHININIQMNYWPAEVTNLHELHLPFLEFLVPLSADGKKTARDMYGMKGSVAHFTTDAWHFTEPYGETQWAMWPMGLAWCANHLWEHYRFSTDNEYLADHAYPVMKDAALFCLNWLVEDPKTRNLVSGPSISPENTFRTSDGGVATMVMGPTMDHMIIRQLFSTTIAAAEILGRDEAFQRKLRNALDKLAPTSVGADGRIMEWTEEFEEPEPGHRHISHLYGLYPGNEINMEKDPSLVEAAKKTIAHRLAHGGGHTGWSRAWIINFFARLKDGDAAYENLLALLRKSTLPNLFDNHPPFQIDGNFGATAGISEMLIQSHTQYVEILPALPQSWRTGSVNGLCARGGFEVNIDWDRGELSGVSILSKEGNTCRVRYGERTVVLETKPNTVYVLDGMLSLIKDDK